MARRETRPTRGQESRSSGRKSGGLFMGLLIGLTIGLVVAAGLAWYFNSRSGEFKPAEQAPEPALPVQPDSRSEPTTPEPKPKPRVQVPVTPPAAQPAPAVKPPPAPIQERKPVPASEPPSRVPLTFYGILPGDKPAKPVEPPKPTEQWWLQVAALKNPADADKLKARLLLLGLDVITQKIESGGQALYRVRVGPYKRDEDAFADLDTLATNNYEPRLLKEPLRP